MLGLYHAFLGWAHAGPSGLACLAMYSWEELGDGRQAGAIKLQSGPSIQTDGTRYTAGSEPMCTPYCYWLLLLQ